MIRVRAARFVVCSHLEHFTVDVGMELDAEHASPEPLVECIPGWNVCMKSFHSSRNLALVF